jgi:hypothetical protein
MIILSKVSSFLMRRVVLVGNVGVSLVRYRCLWLPCCILFWMSCCDVLTRDLRITFEDLLCYIYINVFGWVFIGSCYVFLMGFFPRSVSSQYRSAPVMCFLWASFLDLYLHNTDQLRCYPLFCKSLPFFYLMYLWFQHFAHHIVLIHVKSVIKFVSFFDAVYLITNIPLYAVGYRQYLFTLEV